jgi:hypothetical protein
LKFSDSAAALSPPASDTQTNEVSEGLAEIEPNTKKKKLAKNRQQFLSLNL